MAIYRGPGGPGDATADAANAATLAVQSAADAATSASTAATAAINAGLSQTNAASSASTATTAATNASNSASSAATSATNASNSAANAFTSAANAAASESAASTSASNASSSASSAATSASNASSSASSASSSASSASTSASNAATSASTASASATAAQTSENNVEAIVNDSSVLVLGADLAGTGFDYDLGSVIEGSTGPSGSPNGYIPTVYDNLADIQLLADNVLDIQLVADNINTIASKANSGANSDITSLSGLTTALSISQGGTGQTTANNALNALLPSQASANNKYLKSNGTSTSWDDLDISTADITGTLPIANGGTGATTASGARTNLVAQETLVSGTNIKTVNSTSLLGSGDIAVGTVTSVGLSTPTGLSVAGSPVIGVGTLAISYTAGYSIPTTTSQTNWDTAFTDRLKWDGGSSGLDAATGRTSLGLGSIATQAASSVTITGGLINGTTIGGSTAAAGTFTDLTVTGTFDCGSIS